MLFAFLRRLFFTIRTDMTPLDERSARRKGLYLPGTTQHRNTMTNIHALNGIRTHDLIVQAMKAYTQTSQLLRPAVVVYLTTLF
jgi:hypothetical protein